MTQLVRVNAVDEIADAKRQLDVARGRFEHSVEELRVAFEKVSQWKKRFGKAPLVFVAGAVAVGVLLALAFKPRGDR